jgi:hypothetical protein
MCRVSKNQHNGCAPPGFLTENLKFFCPLLQPNSFSKGICYKDLGWLGLAMAENVIGKFLFFLLIRAVI